MQLYHRTALSFLLSFCCCTIPFAQGNWEHQIFRIDCGSTHSTGFAVKYQGQTGLLTTLHSICNCEGADIKVLKEEIVNGQPITRLFRGAKIKYIDAQQDAAFIIPTKISQMNIRGAYSIPNSAMSGAAFREEYVAYGFPGNGIIPSTLEVDRVHPNNLSPKGILKRQGYPQKSIIESKLPILNTTVINYADNGVIEPGWSGAPIIADNASNPVSMVNGGLKQVFLVPIVFGIDLSRIDFCQVGSRNCSLVDICRQYLSSNVFYSKASYEAREAAVNNKIKLLEKKFDGYYKFLSPRLKGEDISVIPSSIILSVGKRAKSESTPILIHYSRGMKIRNKVPEITVQIVVKKEEGELNLYAKVKEDGVEAPLIYLRSDFDEDGYKYWEVENLLVKAKRFKRRYKLVYLNLDAEVIDGNGVRILNYYEAPKNRRSYIKYPEAKFEDLVLELE